MKEPFQTAYDEGCDAEDWRWVAAVKYAHTHGLEAATEMWPGLHNRLSMLFVEKCPTAALFAVEARDRFVGRMA